MKTLKLIFLLFLTLPIITSCQKADNPPVQLYLSFMDEITPAFQDKIIFAIQEINQEAGKEIVSLTKLKRGKPLTILATRSNTLFAHAQYLDYHCKIEIDDSNPVVDNNDPDQVDLKYILLHEIGHCYGYKHSQSNSHIMYPDYLGTWSQGGNKANAESKISNFLNELKNLF